MWLCIGRALTVAFNVVASRYHQYIGVALAEPSRLPPPPWVLPRRWWRLGVSECAREGKTAEAHPEGVPSHHREKHINDRAWIVNSIQGLLAE